MRIVKHLGPFVGRYSIQNWWKRQLPSIFGKTWKPQNVYYWWRKIISKKFTKVLGGVHELGSSLNWSYWISNQNYGWYANLIQQLTSMNTKEKFALPFSSTFLRNFAGKIEKKFRCVHLFHNEKKTREKIWEFRTLFVNKVNITLVFFLLKFHRSTSMLVNLSTERGFFDW